MDNRANAVQVFRQFAEDRLKEHIAELKTKYENEQLPTREEKMKAYEDHFKDYREELTSRINELSSNHGESKSELDGLLGQYEMKFRNNYTR